MDEPQDPPSSHSYEEELLQLRSDWEQHVKLVEDSVEKLKTGLLESYKRENERYKKLVQSLQSENAPLPEPPISPLSSESIPLPKPSIADASFYQTLRQQIQDTHHQFQTALRPIQESLKQDVAKISQQLPQTQEQVRSLQQLFRNFEAILGNEREDIRGGIHQWENALQTTGSEMAAPARMLAAQNEFDLGLAEARSLIQELDHALSVPRLLSGKGEACRECWKTLEPELQKKFQRLHQELAIQAQVQSTQRKTIEEILDHSKH